MFISFEFCKWIFNEFDNEYYVTFLWFSSLLDILIVAPVRQNTTVGCVQWDVSLYMVLLYDVL